MERVKRLAPAPAVLDRATACTIIRLQVSPQIEQLQTLWMERMERLGVGPGDVPLEQRIQQEQRAFMLRLGLCLRMAFDHYLFARKGVYYDRSALSSAIVYPARALETSVVIFACNDQMSLIAVDAVSVSFLSSSGQVCRSPVPPTHLLGSLFAVAVPQLPWFEESTMADAIDIVVEVACDGQTCQAPLKVTRSAPRGLSGLLVESWSPTKYPLHYQVTREDVASVLDTLSACRHEMAEERDDRGIMPATLALWHGNRVIYTLFTWKALNWPVYAVSQLIRARLELESGVMDALTFFNLRDYLHNCVHVLGGTYVNPPAPRLSASRSMSPPNAAAMVGGFVAPEAPSVVAPPVFVQPRPVKVKKSTTRRGSLDVLLSAIANLERTGM